jgi:hypothetical protein
MIEQIASDGKTIIVRNVGDPRIAAATIAPAHSIPLTISVRHCMSYSSRCVESQASAYAERLTSALEPTPDPVARMST